MCTEKVSGLQYPNHSRFRRFLSDSVKYLCVGDSIFMHDPRKCKIIS